MVFESLVSDLLNRFIGDYVENLDKSQLKIGIWGGNVVLENLKVKENALNELDVPFTVKAGQIGKLTLKIPWKNLYNDAVVATLDGLYLLLVPGAARSYDAAKEERFKQEAKQRELQRIEEALQTAARRGIKKFKKPQKCLKKLKRLEKRAEKRQEEKKDTFMEKLATQVIKNLQVKISSIHLRYEDDLSDPQQPVCVGLTLSEMSLQTTDETWKACILNQAAKVIYKLACLDSLCVYWNVSSPLFSRSSQEDILEELKSAIISKDQDQDLPQDQYIFRPIFASAKMCINPNAEQELSSPKVTFNLEVNNIDIEMTKAQYLTMVEVLESIDCMVRNSPYRKFRPEVSVHANRKLWWRYAFNGIMDVHIRRVSRMWSWTNIRQHRQNLKAYRTAYKSKLVSPSKVSQDTEQQIQDLEKLLDVFNITLARQQVQMEVIRSGQKVLSKKATGGQKQGGGGFFSSFFGRKAKKDEVEQEESKDTERLEDLLTAEEKEKLYTAIGYSGSSQSLALPKQYVALVITFQLLRTSVTIREQPGVPEILNVQMVDLSTRITQRPGAQAFRVEATLQHWYVTGLQQQGTVPSLIASVGEDSSSLLSVVFELNPEGTSADQMLRVSSQPVEIIYDTLTVNSLADFFKTEKGVDLEVLTTATLSKLEEIREKTASGLSHIIETRKVLDLRIDLRPSYFLLPKSGFYSQTSEVIIVDFGSFQLNSVEQSAPSSSSSLEEIMDRAYDRFSVELRRVQLLYSQSGESWKWARSQRSSVQHVLHPMDFTLQLGKCMVEKDARMPRFKVSGELPLMHIKVSDQKIQNILDLVNSIPLPSVGSAPHTPADKMQLLAHDRRDHLGLGPVFLGAMETDSDQDPGGGSGDEDQPLEDLTNLHFKFEVKEVLLELTRQVDQDKPVLSLSVSQLGAEGKSRSFDLRVTSYLRRVTLAYCDLPGGRNHPLHLISSSDQQGSDLLKVDFIKANPKGPRFQTGFLNIEQLLKVEFSSLTFLLHTQALLSTISYLNSLLPSPTPEAPRWVEARPEKLQQGGSVFKAARRGGVFSLQLSVVLGSLHVVVCDDCCSIADIRIQGIDASVMVQVKQMEVSARLRDVVVTDVNPSTIHRKAVSIVGEELFSFQLSLFPGATEGDSYSDMSKVDGKVKMRLGCIQIIYLHKFFMSLLMFVDNFQMAKEAVSAATVQAAGRAASRVRGLAQKSFRLLMDIQLKAPLLVVPQSSTSLNAVLMDLGMITVANSFSLLQPEGFSLPVVVEKMHVKLTQLKLSRTLLKQDTSQPDIQMLQPINLLVLLTRNLAASWFGGLPGVQVQGVLQSLNMSLGEEDLGVLMKILVENIGEGGSPHGLPASRRRLEEGAELPATPPQAAEPEQAAAANDGQHAETVLVLLDFQISEALLTLKKLRQQQEEPFLLLHLTQLGIDVRVRRFDLCATTYIREVTMKSLEFKDAGGRPLCLISSSVETGAELFKVQYFKADRSGPNFSSVYKNTEQMVNASVSSLDVVLHSQALLSAINFLSVALWSRTSRESRPAPEEPTWTPRSTTTPLPAENDIINLKVVMSLGAFNVLVCEQNRNIADIKIRGINSSVLIQGPQTHMSARLRDFSVLNADSTSIHRKVVSIVGTEVFSLALSLTPTEGSSYADPTRSDGRLKLTLSCIQVVYLHKVFMSLLNFSSSFQTARAAVSAATVQAAEKAASSVRHLAQKSFRLSLDINLKAPLLIVPQSSRSQQALVMDLGLITVANSFSLLPAGEDHLPALVDHLDIQLSQLKLSRTSVDQAAGPPAEILEPVNLHLNIRRNLAASWYKKMVAVEILGDMKPMKVELSQEDLTMLLRIPLENLGEASSLGPPSQKQDVGVNLQTSGSAPTASAGVGPSKVPVEGGEPLETLMFTINIESLALVLYTNDPKQASPRQRPEGLRLAEFALHLLKTSGKLWSTGCVEVSTVLSTCTLDDLRAGLTRVTSRMIRQREEDSSQPMVDLTYHQSSGQRELVAVLQKLYLCASVEFLLAVTDFFVQALPQSSSASRSSALSDRLPLRETSEPQGGSRTAASVQTRVRAVVVDPEVVFVASLMKADAPALLASFQCDVSLQTGEDSSQSMRAILSELKVQACPFIRSKQDQTITTVLRPCSVVMETRSQANQPLTGSVTVEEVVVKISPFILSTVMNITAAMRAKAEQQKEDVKPDVSDLWFVSNIYNCNYWFLGVEEATEVTESFREASSCNEGENFSAQIKVFQVTLESGLGHRTVPLLLAESSFNGLAKNWSSLLQLRGDLTLEVNYFNESHAVWEPLIERVDGGRRRWNLELEVRTNPAQDKSPVHGDEFVILPEPRSSISICSRDVLNISVSQAALSVFQHLSKAFSEAASSHFSSFLKEKPPLTITNALGIPLMVRHSASLRVMGAAALGRLHELPVGQSLDLEHTVLPSSSAGRLSTLQRQDSCLFNLTLVPSGYSEISNLAVDRPGRRLYNVRGPLEEEVVSVLLQVDAADGNKMVTVRSPLQVLNHFSVPFTILKFCPASRSLQAVGEADPDTEFHITLDAYRSQLFVCPAGGLRGLFSTSSTCVSWKEEVQRSSEVRSLLRCPSVVDGLLPLTLSALAVPDQLRLISSQGGDWDPAYVLHLFPLVTLRNLLPYTVRYMMESSADSYELPEGSTADLLDARVSGEMVSLVLVRYQGRDWHGHVRIQQDLPEFFSVCLMCELDASLTVDISVHALRTSSSVTLSLFSPYWIVNQTCRVLQYRAENVSLKHPADLRDIVLFSFRKKNIFSKSKLQLCISNSSWSDGFSLDTVGSYGCLRCPASNMDYLVGVSIRMSSFNLTRMVTMSPFFSLLNKSSYELEVGEVSSPSSTRWHYVPSAESLPFWPEDPSGRLCLRVVGSHSTSSYFLFNQQDNGTLLSLDLFGGIIVDVNISEHSTVIGFTDYYQGAAPALLLNHTHAASVSYRQSGSALLHQLGPGEARLFAWDEPAGKRTLCWSCRDHSGELDLLKDQLGQLSWDGLSQVHWVSFLDGRQRVLLFTEDVAVVTKARQAEELEQFHQEVKVSLQNLGVSLVSNSRRQEIAYVGITSSGVVWEMKPKNRWKAFSQKNINLLEKVYQSQLRGEASGGWLSLDSGLEVNLGAASMMMRQPICCPVRRNFLPGIQVEFKQSEHQRSLRAQLHWLQVDNQLPGAIFPIVFHPVPPPRSIALDSEPKPFIDVCVITRFNQHSTIMQFKYFMALIQEMAVKVDQDFLAAMLALFTPVTDAQADRQKTQLLSRDLQLLQAEVMEASLSDSSGLNFFEDFHISPVKLHLSLSLGSSDEPSGQEAAAVQSLNLLLKSIGATLTDVDDLVFKLAFFQVKYQFYRQDKLMWAVVRHYSEQFLKQMYVLVLGLDVLGNPFGLIRGLSEGVEAFFYEPFQGAVQGPEEFAEGFVIGVRSLFGHTVGGAAGVVSRITGSVGKGLAAITMDKEYQQKRREEMNRPPRDFAESLAKGGKGLLKGVVGGVTGIVTKPVEGAKKEGATGFFKGIGKGLVGVVARPTGGIVDMASSTFQGIQRVAESTEEVSKLRPVRLIREDGIIRPYDPTESEGLDLFQRSQIKQLEGEVFQGHAPLGGHRKTNVLVTNRRIVCVKEIDFVGHFNKEWECLFENLSQPPDVSGPELKLFFKQRKLALKREDQECVRTLRLRDEAAAQSLKTTILEAQASHQLVRQRSQHFLTARRKQ